MKNVDAQTILEKLAKLRAAMPRSPQPLPNDEGRMRVAGETFNDFDLQAIADALESMTSELGAALKDAHTKAMNDALDVYYTAEELARDPAHADLIPHVESMRRAYERDFGMPIPPRGRGR